MEKTVGVVKEDEKYVVSLSPKAFHELTEVLEDYYSMSQVQAGLTLREERLMVTILKAVNAADAAHKCIDEKVHSDG